MAILKRRVRPEPWSRHRERAKYRWLIPFIAIEWGWAWLAYWLSGWAFLEVLEYFGTLSLLLAVISYFSESKDRLKQKHYQAWQVINSAQGKGGSGGRIDALEELHADGVPLVGVDVGGAFLQGVDLSRANLLRANFRAADVRGGNLNGAQMQYVDLASANFRDANLRNANLRNATLQDADLTGANLGEVDLEGGRSCKSGLAKLGFSQREMAEDRGYKAGQRIWDQECARRFTELGDPKRCSLYGIGYRMAGAACPGVNQYE